jgi:hypothetical protein
MKLLKTLAGFGLIIGGLVLAGWAFCVSGPETGQAATPT